MTTKQRQEVYSKFGGKCAYTGKPLGNDWQVDHAESRKWAVLLMKNADDPDNLLPTLKIVNHYKRAKNLEDWRVYMKTFHLRLAKLPKNTRVAKRAKTKEYMLAIADAFGITIDKPFDGIFYFETLKPIIS